MNPGPLRPYIWMLLGSLAFATMGILAREASSLWDWQLIAMVRAFMPMVLVAVLAWRYRVRLVFFRPRALWMRSIAGSVSLVGTFYSLSLPQLPVADVFTVTNMFPIWLALFSWPLLGEAPSPFVWLSVLCSLTGVYLISPLDGADFRLFLPLAVSISTALAMIGLHRLKEIDTLAVVVHFSMVALFFSGVSFVIFEHKRPVEMYPDSMHLLQLCGVGLAATIGQLFLTKAFTMGNPAKVSVVGLMQVVFALLLEWLLSGEPPFPYKLLGVELVIAPTAWLMIRQQNGVLPE